MIIDNFFNVFFDCIAEQWKDLCIEYEEDDIWFVIKIYKNRETRDGTKKTLYHELKVSKDSDSGKKALIREIVHQYFSAINVRSTPIIKGCHTVYKDDSMAMDEPQGNIRVYKQ